MLVGPQLCAHLKGMVAESMLIQRNARKARAYSSGISKSRPSRRYTSHTLHVSQFSPANLQTSTPKRNQLGGLRIDLEYKDPALNGSHYLIQTPKLRLPFIAQQYDNENQHRVRKIELLILYRFH